MKEKQSALWGYSVIISKLFHKTFGVNMLS